MQAIIDAIKSLGIAVLISIAMPVFADPAPVYDADAAVQQEDNVNIGAAEQPQDFPPPPPPGQEGAYVPNQNLAPSQPSSSFSAPPISESIEQRMRRMEQQVNNMQNNDVSARMDSLQDQVQTLRGQVEQLTHQLQQAQTQQKSMFTDIDKRLSQQAVTVNQPVNVASNNTASNTALNALNNDAVSARAIPAAGKTTRKTSKSKMIAANEEKAVPAANDQPNVAEEQQIYQTAYNLIKAKKYDDAVNALQGMLKKYPSGQFASNAHYWLGELYGLMGKTDNALAEFSAVVKTFPDSPRVSDAQLKVGLIYASQTKWTEAKAAFKKVINKYPGTASAKLASDQLKQIKLAGH